MPFTQLSHGETVQAGSLMTLMAELEHDASSGWCQAETGHMREAHHWRIARLRGGVCTASRATRAVGSPSKLDCALRALFAFLLRTAWRSLALGA
eukprot:CAMPEP_0206036898 /NCGR_PEP_ID=MMETSP1466-20131121/3097_1 /ASSEMBLY_ACC=CAM_ASM_001126 /TAXON_ID=44452 /ORGANISM="Pavlova gyrans, Strain CCMP608" /LENGTH=94 /DNA_ID=CAMNT_0053411419 /DNA_START=143 /DNA_END=428 /DNA_ORIENTATION=+